MDPNVLDDPEWTIEGSQGYGAVKSYDLMEGEVDGLGSDDLIDPEVIYYYVEANSGYAVTATAGLRRNGGTAQATATATYNVSGPTNISMTTKTIPGGWVIAPYTANPASLYLRFGQVGIHLDSTGIQFTFTASAPAGDNGYVTATQLFFGEAGWLPPAEGGYDTDGDYWLDGCPLYYNGYETANGGQYTWKGNDSPRVPLTSADTIAEMDTRFRTYFMYRPEGSTSIWVPIGELEWSLEAVARRDITSGTWSMVDEDASVDPTGEASSDFPEWDEVFEAPGVECGGGPANLRRHTANAGRRPPLHSGGALP